MKASLLTIAACILPTAVLTEQEPVVAPVQPEVPAVGLSFDPLVPYAGESRKYTLAECRELVEFLKADGCAVMLGVPNRPKTTDSPFA